jgi:hypothetical protein
LWEWLPAWPPTGLPRFCSNGCSAKEYVDAETVHRFAEAPQVMEQELWLRTRGGTIPDPLALPPPDDPDRKLN